MRKNAFTLLGGILEERLSWKDHMTIITNKVAKNVGPIHWTRHFPNKNPWLIFIITSSKFFYELITHKSKLIGPNGSGSSLSISARLFLTFSYNLALSVWPAIFEFHGIFKFLHPFCKIDKFVIGPFQTCSWSHHLYFVKINKELACVQYQVFIPGWKECPICEKYEIFIPDWNFTSG